MSPRSLIPILNQPIKIAHDPSFDTWPPPNQFGAPAKFDQWRTFQAQAAASVYDSQFRWIAQCMPTGSGKSLVNMMAAILPGKRMAYLTSTLGLQTQLLNDEWPGLVDIRGMGNYKCIEASPGGMFYDEDLPSHASERSDVSCDHGPCTAGIYCPRTHGGCEYFDHRARAISSRLVITNYKYWMHVHRYGEGLGPFDILVLDEAHDAPNELNDFVGMTFTTSDMMDIKGEPEFPDPAYTMENWKDWAGYWGGQVNMRAEGLTAQVKEMQSLFRPKGLRKMMRELRRTRNLVQKLARLANVRGEWVLEHKRDKRNGRYVKFDSIWPQAYGEECLFLGVPKIVLSSATIRPKTLELLGIPDDQYDFREYPSHFPVERRPVIHVTTAPMSNKASDAMRIEWHTRIDQIIKWRQDRKGIIHTVSYDRARTIAAESEFHHLMMLNDSSSTKDTVAEFKSRTDPCILVSPSVTTGYDFPYEECEYVIISKVPFPPPVDLIIRARSERDRYYSHYLAVLEMVQMAGRGMRAEDDQCEIIIVDDQVVAPWFIKSLRNFSPDWFWQSFRSQRILPPPLPKLRRAA